jgi:hypothetical protein
MARGDLKVSPLSVIHAHRQTYIDAATGSSRLADKLELEVVPVGAAVAFLLFDVNLSEGAAIGMLTAAGILSALFFGLMLQISERAMDWADANPEPGPDTSRHAQYLIELAANAGYTSLVAIVLLGVLVGASVSTGWTLRVCSAIALGASVHLVLLLLMIMKRVFVLTSERLRRARTGAGLSHH